MNSRERKREKETLKWGHVNYLVNTTLRRRWKTFIGNFSKLVFMVTLIFLITKTISLTKVKNYI